MGRHSGVLLVVLAVAAGCKLQRSSAEPASLSEAIADKVEELREEQDQKRARVNKRKATHWLRRACRRSSAKRFTRAVSASKYAELAEEAGWTTKSPHGQVCRNLEVVAVGAEGPKADVSTDKTDESADEAEGGFGEDADAGTAADAETDAEKGD